MIGVLQAGNYVKDEVWHALIVVITNASDLHGYAVRSLYRAVHKVGEQVHHTFPLSSIGILVPVTHEQFSGLEYVHIVYCILFFDDRIVYCILFDCFCQETLVRVAVWCIGEYGEMLVNNVGRLDIEEPTTVSSCFCTVVCKYDL